MRKNWCIMIFAMMIAGPAWCAGFSLSGGAGGLLGGLFSRYSIDADNGAVQLRASDLLNQFNYGGFLFLDGQLIQLSVGLQGGQNTYQRESNMNSAESGSGSEMMLGIGLLGKYPITLNSRWSAFPLVGVEYQMALLQYRQKDGGTLHDRTDGKEERDAYGNPYDLSAWDSFFINVGAGMDYHFASSLFLRATLLYQIRLMTAYEQDQLALSKYAFGVSDPKLSGLTSGPVLKIAAGWRFF